MKCITLASAMLLFWAVNGVQSLKCYTCSSNAAAPNFKCENDALNVPLVDCSPQMVYCLTMVTESATLGLIFSPMNRPLIWSNETVVFFLDCRTSQCHAQDVHWWTALHQRPARIPRHHHQLPDLSERWMQCRSIRPCRWAALLIKMPW